MERRSNAYDALKVQINEVRIDIVASHGFSWR